VRLTEIFRQKTASRIVASAHTINRGDYPDLNSNSSDADFFFLRRPAAKQAVETVLELCSSRLPGKMGLGVLDIQVLSPTRRGEAGTRNLNAVLQERLNPHSEGRKEKIFGDISFRQGDRVMQTRNNYDIIWHRTAKLSFEDDRSIMPLVRVSLGDKPEGGLGVYNGDVGFISDIDFGQELMYVLFDDRLAVYGFEQLSELEHAYAMTVHKAQGSEYPAVVFVALEGAPQLMNRKVLYTAVTRAKRLLIVAGSDRAVHSMIDNHKVAARYSGLRARLTEL
jgi:exodeoxyribonuclease V alpha subunit